MVPSTLTKNDGIHLTFTCLREKKNKKTVQMDQNVFYGHHRFSRPQCHGSIADRKGPANQSDFGSKKSQPIKNLVDAVESQSWTTASLLAESQDRNSFVWGGGGGGGGGSSSGVASRKKIGEKGEAGGSVAKLMGRITNRNILKQKAKSRGRESGGDKQTDLSIEHQPKPTETDAVSDDLGSADARPLHDLGLGPTHPLTLERLHRPPLECGSPAAPKTPNSRTRRWTEVEVLVHLIDGFEIEESGDPFPVEKPELEAEPEVEPDVMTEQESSIAKTEPSLEENIVTTTTTTNESDPVSIKEEIIEESFPSETPTCGARETTISNPPLGITSTEVSGVEEDHNDDDSISIGSKEGLDSSSSPPSHSPVSFPLRDVSSTDSLPDEKPLIVSLPDGADMAAWTERDVYDFVRGIEGCSQYAEEFVAQEIDGQALVLLNEEHLMTNLNVKLGPALKILAKIKEKT